MDRLNQNNMILEHKANGQEFLIVEIEHDATEFTLDGNELMYKAYFLGLPNIGRLRILPSGTYSILFTAEEATEEQAAEIMADSWSDIFHVWDDHEHIGYSCFTAKDCMKTFIRANFTDQSKKHLILKKHS